MERLFRLYLGREPKKDELFALYACAALGGFLWCLWAVYKKALERNSGNTPLLCTGTPKTIIKSAVPDGQPPHSRALLRGEQHA